LYESEWLAVVVVVGLVLVRLAWPNSERRARRRKARAARTIAEAYRKERRNVLGTGRPVTVAELVERMARENHMARRTAMPSQRKGSEGRPGEDDRPTEALPPIS
jgi:hypothetical protein